MITRKQLVEALRVLHENDQIVKIQTRAKRIDIHFITNGRDGLLVLPHNDTNTRNKTKSKLDPITRDILADVAGAPDKH